MEIDMMITFACNFHTTHTYHFTRVGRTNDILIAYGLMLIKDVMIYVVGYLRFYWTKGKEGVTLLNIHVATYNCLSIRSVVF